MSGGLRDPITRLVLRLFLLYVQQAPVPRARDCVQQALFLLLNLLDAHDTASRYCQLHASHVYTNVYIYIYIFVFCLIYTYIFCLPRIY